MCLIVLAWRMRPDFPLVVAANRDEFHARPSAGLGRWEEDPRVLGGRDLEAGGTWLGVREDGRFGAVTNVREPGAPRGTRSRGHLVRDFLLGSLPPGSYAAGVPEGECSGFNLLVADGRELWYRSNRDGGARQLGPGVFGVSNHLLDTPWPKLVSAKAKFGEALEELPDTRAFFQLLGDREHVSDEELPQTGLPIEWERLLSSIFVKSEKYGTRASTVLLMGQDGAIRMEERRFGPNGAALGSTLI